MSANLLKLPDALTPLERAVLKMMLDQPGEQFASVAAQIAYAEVASRKFTGVGGYLNFSIPSQAPFYCVLPDANLGGVYGGIYDEHQKLKTLANFELSISDGCIRYLEFVTPEHEWPADESQIKLSLF